MGAKTLLRREWIPLLAYVFPGLVVCGFPCVVNADISSAKRGKVSTTVKVRGKTANADLDVELKVGATWIWIGKVTTDGSGNGKTTWLNTTSTAATIMPAGGQIRVDGNEGTVVLSKHWLWKVVEFFFGINKVSETDIFQCVTD